VYLLQTSLYSGSWCIGFLYRALGFVLWVYFKQS